MNDYWLKRAEAAYARSNKSVSKALPELISNMQDARRALEKEINAFYARYASNNKITLAEAQKALSLHVCFCGCATGLQIPECGQNPTA